MAKFEVNGLLAKDRRIKVALSIPSLHYTIMFKCRLSQSQ